MAGRRRRPVLAGEAGPFVTGWRRLGVGPLGRRAAARWRQLLRWVMFGAAAARMSLYIYIYMNI